MRTDKYADNSQNNTANIANNTGQVRYNKVININIMFHIFNDYIVNFYNL